MQGVECGDRTKDKSMAVDQYSDRFLLAYIIILLCGPCFIVRCGAQVQTEKEKILKVSNFI